MQWWWLLLFCNIRIRRCHVPVQFVWHPQYFPFQPNAEDNFDFESFDSNSWEENWSKDNCKGDLVLTEDLEGETTTTWSIREVSVMKAPPKYVAKDDRPASKAK